MAAPAAAMAAASASEPDVPYRRAPSQLGDDSVGDPGAGQRGGNVSDEDDDELGELRRADTASIVGDFQGAGAGVVVGGLALAAVHSGMAAVLVWYSTQVPRSCRARLGVTFRLMGSLDGVLSVLIVCFVLAAKGLVDAMSHGVLAEKYEIEGRTEEAELQKEEAAKKMAGAFLQGCFPAMGFMLVQAGLLATWIFGIWQATHATGPDCGGATTVFWGMLAVNACSGVLTACLDTRVVPRAGGLASSGLLGFAPAGADPEAAEVAGAPEAGQVVQV